MNLNICPNSLTFDKCPILKSRYNIAKTITGLPDFNFVELTYHFYIENYKLDPIQVNYIDFRVNGILPLLKGNYINYTCSNTN